MRLRTCIQEAGIPHPDGSYDEIYDELSLAKEILALLRRNPTAQKAHSGKTSGDAGLQVQDNWRISHFKVSYPKRGCFPHSHWRFGEKRVLLENSPTSTKRHRETNTKKKQKRQKKRDTLLQGAAARYQGGPELLIPTSKQEVAARVRKGFRLAPKHSHVRPRTPFVRTP